MAISLGRFIDTTKGKSVGVPWNKKLDGECVSLLQQYVFQCFDVPMKVRGHAKYFGNSLVNEGVAKFVKTPRYGDIQVYNGNYGHVSIYIDGRTIYDQNNRHLKPERVALLRPTLPNKPIQYVRMNKALVPNVKPPTKPKYEKEVWAFTSTVNAINIRENPLTNAKIVGSLKKGQTYNYKQKYDDGKNVWVSNGKTWIAVREIKNGKRQELWGTLHAQKSKPKPKKEYIQLSAKASSWRFYQRGVAMRAGNEIAKLAPKKFGGLEYEVLGRPSRDAITIRTGQFGIGNIFVGASARNLFKIVKK